MRITRKAAVTAVATGLLLGAGISGWAAIDCGGTEYGTGYCATSPSGDAVIGWDVQRYGIAAGVGPMTFTADWARPPQPITATWHDARPTVRQCTNHLATLACQGR